ncbi:hypothetical protein ACDI10_16380 [Vreelandella venusta]|uniref:DUF4376 domain-containing protein n=1 Tax=Vreelandella venusta TaxID=44935 RepID=UPI0035585544
MIVYELDKQSIWTGVTKELNPGQGRPRNYTPITPPDVPEGRMAQLRGRRWVLIDSVPLSDVQRRAHEARKQVDEWRDSALNSGMLYTMPGGTKDIVQTRPEDRLNLIALNVNSEVMVAAEVTTSISFRGLSNTTYQLTPAEMRDMTMAALAHIEGIYKKSWEIKDELGVVAALDDIDAALSRLNGV